MWSSDPVRKAYVDEKVKKASSGPGTLQRYWQVRKRGTKKRRQKVLQTGTTYSLLSLKQVMEVLLEAQIHKGVPLVLVWALKKSLIVPCFWLSLDSLHYLVKMFPLLCFYSRWQQQNKIEEKNLFSMKFGLLCLLGKKGLRMLLDIKYALLKCFCQHRITSLIVQ